MTADAELWDYLQERWGFGEWDEATSDIPWWKFRANGIGQLTSMMRKRRVKPHELVAASEYAEATAKPITALWQLFGLIPEAVAARRQQERLDAEEARGRALQQAIHEAMEAGEREWADRLMRAAPSEAQTVINEWRSST